MTVKTYDVKCYELAEHFLQDMDEDSAENRIELAREIQQAIEDWFETKR